MKIIIYCMLITSCSISYAALNSKKGHKSDNKDIHQVINKYRNTPAVEMSIDKTVKMKLLGNDSDEKSSGSLYLSSNKMRYEIIQPMKHLIVMNDIGVWIQNTLPEDMGGKVQVTHLKSKSGQDKVKGFLAAFFGNKNIKDDMSFIKIDDQNFDIKFKKKSLIQDLKSAKIGIDSKAKKIEYLEYTDRYNNITTHRFSDIKFKKRKNLTKFKYTPPKNAVVTEM